MTASRIADGLDELSNPEWASRGACRDVDPETLFVVGAAQHKAKTICMACPVRIECLADALDSRAEFGVWGGMTERERRLLLRRRPDVGSWRTFLQTAKRSGNWAGIPQPTVQRRQSIRSMH